MKTLKTFFSILLLLLLVCVLAVGSLMLFINPNQLKPVIISQMMRQTGYLVTMEGNLHWSFYPRVGVKVERMTLRDPDQTEPFLTLSGLQVATDLKSLMRGVEKLNGNVYVSEVDLLRVRLSNVTAFLNWENNVLSILQLRGTCYEGELTGDVFGRTLYTSPMWNWKIELNRVQLKPLLLDLNGANTKLNVSGLGNVTFQGSTRGKTRHEVISQLNGLTRFNINNGAVEGINLNYYVRSASAILQSQPLPAEESVNQTAFSTFAGSGTINNGVVSTNELYVVSSAFMARGTGTIALESEAINLNLQLKPMIDFKWPLEVPLAITGTLRQPQVGLDKWELQKFLAGQRVQELKAKASEEVKKHVPGKAGEFLQKLLR